MTSLEYAVFAERTAYLAYAKALDDEAPVNVIARLHQSRDDAQDSLWALADDIIAGTYSASPAPTQTIALDALVAWRDALKAIQEGNNPAPQAFVTLREKHLALESAADLLIAERAKETKG